MMQSEAKYFLPLIKAWGEGKTLQIHTPAGNWVDIIDPLFGSPLDCYRIKPEPTKLTYEKACKCDSTSTPHMVLRDVKNQGGVGVTTFEFCTGMRCDKCGEPWKIVM